MLMVKGVIKLIDFGCARQMNSPEQVLMSLTGTPYWMSPEVIKQEGHGSKADIWSCGCTVFEMVITNKACFK